MCLKGASRRLIKSFWGITLSVSLLKKAFAFYEKALGRNRKKLREFHD